LNPEVSESRFLDVGLETSLDDRVRTNSGNQMNFLFCSLSVSADGIYINVTVMVIFQSRAGKHPSSACRAFLDKDLSSWVLVLSDTKPKG